MMSVSAPFLSVSFRCFLVSVGIPLHASHSLGSFSAWSVFAFDGFEPSTSPAMFPPLGFVLEGS